MSPQPRKRRPLVDSVEEAQAAEIDAAQAAAVDLEQPEDADNMGAPGDAYQTNDHDGATITMQNVAFIPRHGVGIADGLQAQQVGPGRILANAGAEALDASGLQLAEADLIVVAVPRGRGREVAASVGLADGRAEFTEAEE